MKLVFLFIVQAMLIIGPAGIGLTADSSQGVAEQIVKGDVLLKEGDEYVIKEMSGHEVRVHVNSETKKDGVIKVGDKVEVTVTREGHATSIKQQIPQ